MNWPIFFAELRICWRYRKQQPTYYDQEHGFDPARITLYTLIDTPALERNVQQAREMPSIYPTLGLPENALIVGGCGNAEWRKGNDLFVTLARQVIGRAANGREGTTDKPIHFVWVGVPNSPLRDDLLLDIRKAGLSDRIHLIAPTPDVLRYMSQFDVFVLCSREDPYPLVVFEAGLCGVPVVCFAGAGGSPELVETRRGLCGSLPRSRHDEQPHTRPAAPARPSPSIGKTVGRKNSGTPSGAAKCRNARNFVQKI